MHLCLEMYICQPSFMYVYMYDLSMYSRMSLGLSMFLCLCLSICMYACMYVFMLLSEHICI